MVIVAHSSGKKRSIACTKKQSEADAMYVEGYQFGFSIIIVIATCFYTIQTLFWKVAKHQKEEVPTDLLILLALLLN